MFCSSSSIRTSEFQLAIISLPSSSSFSPIRLRYSVFHHNNLALMSPSFSHSSRPFFRSRSFKSGLNSSSLNTYEQTSNEHRTQTFSVICCKKCRTSFIAICSNHRICSNVGVRFNQKEVRAFCKVLIKDLNIHSNIYLNILVYSNIFDSSSNLLQSTTLIKNMNINV